MNEYVLISSWLLFGIESIECAFFIERSKFSFTLRGIAVPVNVMINMRMMNETVWGPPGLQSKEVPLKKP